tara:strand:+ start:1714 stop:1932 length:219 start_codon:yes stop_codon:yes gene_type:complete
MKIMNDIKIKSTAEYRIAGFTLKGMLSMAYALGRIDERYHPEDDWQSRSDNAICNAAKTGKSDKFEILIKKK